ncbi:hypothetical protein BPJM79_10733 [Bacillus pumilus]
MSPVNDVPNCSTCSSLTIFVVSKTNNRTRPITDAGIGIGKYIEMRLETNITVAKINA